MKKEERDDLLREIIRRYAVAKNKNKVWGRECSEEYTYQKGVLIDACTVLGYEIVELSNCISLKSHNSGRIILTEFIDELVM